MMDTLNNRGARGHTKTNRDELLRDKERVIEYLRNHGGSATTAEVSADLGMTKCKPGFIAGQFPMSLAVYRDYSMAKTRIELHPHLMPVMA